LSNYLILPSTQCSNPCAIVTTYNYVLRTCSSHLIYQSTHPSIHPSSNPPIHQSTHPSIHPSIAAHLFTQHEARIVADPIRCHEALGAMTPSALPPSVPFFVQYQLPRCVLRNVSGIKNAIKCLWNPRRRDYPQKCSTMTTYLPPTRRFSPPTDHPSPTFSSSTSPSSCHASSSSLPILGHRLLPPPSSLSLLIQSSILAEL
jgi:hypothetical protein